MRLSKDTPENALGTAVAVLLDEATGKIILSFNQRMALPHWRLPGGRIKSRDLDPKRPFDGRLAAHNAIRNIVKHVTGLSIIRLNFITENPRVDRGGLYVFAGIILHNMRVQLGPIKIQMFSSEEILGSDQTLGLCRESIEEALRWKG